MSLLTCAQADLVNRWSFNNAPGNAPAGTTIEDRTGTSAATVVGNNATFDGAALTIPGNTNGNQTPANIAAYVDLQNGLISSKTNLSIEIWATPVSIKNWQRLFDFGRMGQLSNNVRGGGQVLAGEILPTATQAPNNATSSDNVALAIHRDTTANTQRMMARLDGGTELGSNTGANLTAGTRYHFLCTFTDGAGASGATGGQLAWYLNGTLVSTLDVNFRLSEIQDRNNWLGRSMYSADSNANIAYDEVRIYDHVLTSAEITASIAAGPDQLGTPEPDPAPVPDNLWDFTTQAQAETPSGTTFTDSIGGTVATLRGNGGSLTGGAVVLPGSTTGNQPASTISAYIDLPNGLISQTPSMTIEAWASPLSSKNWQRLFDFGRCASSHGSEAAAGEVLDTGTAPGNTTGYDNLSLTFNNAGNMNSQQLEGQYDGNAAQYSFSTAATTAGTMYHYVLVVEDGIGTHGSGGCQARWYRNGALQNSMDFPFRLSGMEDVNNWIGRSMYSGDSNSHMALDELRIYRRAITQGEITASFAAGPDPAVGPPEPPAPAPIPTRRWTFDTAAGNAPAGTTFLDIATGEVATVRGNGATLTGSQLVLSSAATNGNQTASNISAYLDLPNGIVSSRPDLTFEAWATPVSSKNWQRLFDFGSASMTSGPGAQAGEIIDSATAPGNFVANDNLFLSINNGGTLGSHRLEAKLDGGSTVTNNTDLSSVTAAGTQYHYVMTVKDGGGASGAAGCLVKWFRNGSLIGSIDLPYRLPDLRDVNNWIGRSMWAADSNSHLSLNELRIYDRAITTAEVATTFSAGPDAVFTPPVAANDEATIHPQQKVLIDVLANDTGGALPGTLAIDTPPSLGTATVKGGKILYAHSGSSAAPVTFTYRVGNVSGTTATATVTIRFAASLRLTNPSLAMPEAPPVNAWQLVDALPGLTFNEPLCITGIPGDTRQLYVCERMAKIKRVADVTATAPVQNVFLDLQNVVAGRTPAETIEGGANAEHGLLGMAFHPQYAANGYLYVAYTVRISGGSYYQRLSRFTASGDRLTAVPGSELILLQQLDEGSNHDGGDLHFGPDGYLYYATGDEENSNRGPLNSQKLDGDFFAGIFRIDVDLEPGDYTANDGSGSDDGNLRPNTHAAVVLHDGKPAFEVPIDNPFIHTSLGGTWTGSYNGTPVTNLANVRTEYWATGLRHIWRMSFDSATGDLWAGDVGQNTYEEVNKITKGGNYGWGYREGAHAYNGPLGTAPSGFTSIDPFYEYVHTAIAGGDANFKGNSVVGGHVYRGTRYPALAGSYVFSDSVSGHVWQMDTTTGTTARLTGLPGAYGVISAQGVDPYNKDLLFCAYLTGKIMRLGTGSVSTGAFPATLTATGLFADLGDLSPSPGLLPYQPNLSFWSDHAIKRRWFTIPDASARMTWSKDGNWTYPTGMVWVKHFDLEMSRGNPATKKRIETRVLVKTDTGSYGVSYRWNESQDEAYLVEDAGAEFDLAIDDHGTPHTQHWQIPGRSSCLTCHTPQGGQALSFNTRQLNLTNAINGYSGNQIDLLAANGFLANAPGPVATLARHIRPEETAYPLEQRARSYFAVNCSYCHQTGGSVSGFWDGRAHLTLEQTGMINGAADNNGGNPANKYIVPGDTTHSIILNRMAATNGFGRMPPLGTSEVDPANIQLITEWINSDLPTRPLYDQWRNTFFASNDPAGIKTADPDGDGVSNYDEYLLGSSPVSGSGAWQASITNGSLQFLRKSHRYYAIQTSKDLTTWQPWSIPQIDHSYQSTDTITEIPLPADSSGRKFFRFQVTEP
ncbi:PQQ-dependent sugar dehydrogenase [Luteolibacter flavescens]|uniref:PQQ-dependent sugar dehydrogenase n=1 Tax=Luteolibacter flavescens TaxID=1859460 RepID=A0ABT3FKV6_9BACT|nr:LamG-like jellyroll fold domain-containing protein [Luteolibacter flavescens]MCW1883630.1 PQQ-dependent sugar dehydrogenase [Luteolibacter flavescens]